MASPRAYTANFKIHIETAYKIDKGTATTPLKEDTDPDSVTKMENELLIAENQLN